MSFRTAALVTGTTLVGGTAVVPDGVDGARTAMSANEMATMPTRALEAMRVASRCRGFGAEGPGTARVTASVGNRQSSWSLGDDAFVGCLPSVREDRTAAEG
jgi:hypothetical protein